MRKNTDLRKRILIFSGVIILLLVLLGILVDVKAVFRLLGRVDWWLLLASVVPLLVGYTLITTRWRYVLANKPGWLETFYADSIGYMAKVITPVPATVSRVITTGWVTPVSIPQATSGMVVERLLESIMRLVTLIVLLTLVAARYTDTTTVVLVGLILIVVALAAISWLLKHRERVVARLVSWLSRLPRLSVEQIRGNLDETMQGLDQASSRRRLVVGLLFSLLMWTIFLTFHYLALSSVPIFLRSANETLVVAVVILLVVPPSTPAMVVIYQTIVISVLLVFRLANSTDATAYAIVLFLPQLVCWLALGIWSLLRTNLNLRDILRAARQLLNKEQT